MKRLVCRPARLLAKSDEEAEQITKLAESTVLPGEVAKELDLLGLADTASSQREESLRKKLEEQKNKAARLISAAEFAMSHKSFTTAEYEPTMAWERKPPTDKQMKYLERAGINLETVSGFGHASKLLDIYFKNKSVQLATTQQRYKMRQMGYPNWNHATEQEARQFFAKLRAPQQEMNL